MNELRYTLLPDGSSDRALLPILTWLLREHFPDYAIQANWADLRALRSPPQKLPDRIQRSLYLYPCDLLFVHRDAENQPHSARINEIRQGIAGLAQASVPPTVCVVPVRMQESWLLIDEQAIRHAASNPNGQQPLELPSVDTLEDVIDPKALLYDLLRTASGLRSKRLKKFPVKARAVRVAELIEDFTPLRRLPAFNVLEADIAQIRF